MSLFASKRLLENKIHDLTSEVVELQLSNAKLISNAPERVKEVFVPVASEIVQVYFAEVRYDPSSLDYLKGPQGPLREGQAAMSGFYATADEAFATGLYVSRVDALVGEGGQYFRLTGIQPITLKGKKDVQV